MFGGYGFIGSYIVSDLGKRGSQLVIPTRATENKVQHIRQMGDLGQVNQSMAEACSMGTCHAACMHARWSGAFMATQHALTSGHAWHAQIVFVPQFDIRDDALVKKAISRSNVIINLIGQRTETMNYKYEEVHADWPKKLAT